MVDLKYPECSCIIPPDATKYPNFGRKYDEVVAKVPAMSNCNGITVSCVGYATKCAVHGKIYIMDSVASVPIKFTFC